MMETPLKLKAPDNLIFELAWIKTAAFKRYLIGVIQDGEASEARE